MSQLEVRVERLGPMRVASFRAVSENPELEAWEKLKSWADPRGFLKDREKHPLFGFNNPSPSEDRKEYGYEFWIRVDADTRVEGDVEVKDFPGGRYAVTTHKGPPNPQIWRELWDWAQKNGYKWRKTHELERIHDPFAAESDLVFDLLLPIED